MLGARYQSYYQNNSNGFQKPKNTLNDKDDQFLPQAGLVYKLTPSLSLYGNYSRSFTPSTAIDDNGDVATPETGTTYEVGGNGRSLRRSTPRWRSIASMKAICRSLSTA